MHYYAVSLEKPSPLRCKYPSGFRLTFRINDTDTLRHILAQLYAQEFVREENTMHLLALPGGRHGTSGVYKDMH